jgi:hypothetical protein
MISPITDLEGRCRPDRRTGAGGPIDPMPTRQRLFGTTCYIRRYPPGTQLRVVSLDAESLPSYCRRTGTRDALVGGFFHRGQRLPLGEVWIDGRLRAHVGFDDGYAHLRPAVLIHPDGEVVIDRRVCLPAHTGGDLLQAGPLLVRDDAIVYDRGRDVEGFSACAYQFDSDITCEPHPRSALGVTAAGELISFACDGRAPNERGLLLEEVAQIMLRQGCRAALNLDGGGSTQKVAAGRLVNAPRDMQGRVEDRPIYTAFTFAVEAITPIAA